MINIFMLTIGQITMFNISKTLSSLFYSPQMDRFGLAIQFSSVLFPDVAVLKEHCT